MSNFFEGGVIVCACVCQRDPIDSKKMAPLLFILELRNGSFRRGFLQTGTPLLAVAL